MKVLIANGESLQIEKYEPVVVHVDGDNTKGIMLYFVDISEAGVRNLLSNMENFATIEIVSDKNIHVDTLTGYQTKVSVALGEDENSYIVTLAQGTDTTARVKLLRAEMTNLSKTVEDALVKMNDAATAITEIAPKLKEYSEKNTDIEKKVTDQGEALKTTLEEFVTAKTTMQSALNKMADVERRESEINTRLDTILADNNIAIAAVNEAVSKITGIYVNLDQMTAGFMAKLDNMVAIEDEARNIRSIAAENDNSIKLAVGRTEKVDAALEQYEAKISKQDEVLGENKTAVEKAEQAVSEVAERVAALEPVADITKLTLEEAKKYRVVESQDKLAAFLESHPITSDCHNGITAIYSITAEKQRYLQAMILIATTAEANGVPYQPSWNTAGEPCTYDWTIPQLQQLAMEIEGVVRPLVSQQQSIERDIMQCTSMDDLVAVNISYTITAVAPDTTSGSGNTGTETNTDNETEEV